MPKDSLSRRMLDHTLAYKAMEHWRQHRCPCCNRQMLMPRGKMKNESGAVPSNYATVGHDIPRHYDGAVAMKRWIFTCYRCNMEQGERTFAEWGRHLAHFKDARAAAVAAVAAFFEEHMPWTTTRTPVSGSGSAASPATATDTAQSSPTTGSGA